MCQAYEITYSGGGWWCPAEECNRTEMEDKECARPGSADCHEEMMKTPIKVTIPIECPECIDMNPRISRARHSYEDAIRETPGVLEPLESLEVRELASKIDLLDVRERVLKYHKAHKAELLGQYCAIANAYMENFRPEPGRNNECYRKKWTVSIRNYVNALLAGKAIFVDDGALVCGASAEEQPPMAREIFWRWEEEGEQFR